MESTTLYFCILCIIVFICICIYLYYKNTKLLDNRFYNYEDIYPELNMLKLNRPSILKDINTLNKIEWTDWPEKELYGNDMEWKIFPFYGFGIWINDNCTKCPNITNLLKKIPNLMTATLSKFKPGTKLAYHQGWGKLSNQVLRCHYGIQVPERCLIYVEDEERPIKNDDIIVFDDSKEHSASNFGDSDRIILILDIKRPNTIKEGESKVNDTSELNAIINSFKLMNLKKNNGDGGTNT